MPDLNSILTSLLIVSGIAFVCVAVYVLLRVARTIEATSREITALNKSVTPLLEKVASMVEEAEAALSILTDNRDDIAEAVANIRRVTQNVSRAERLVFEKIEPSLVGIASVVSGLHKGLRTFIESWQRSHS